MIGNKKALVPRLRFPEFREAGEWDKCSLGQIAKLYKGKGISKSDIKPNGSLPCIRYGELYTLYAEVIDKVVSKTDLPPSDLFLSCEDDVIIPSSGETKIDIATAACVKRKNIALGGDLNVIRSNHNGDFLSYQLNGTLRHEIAKVAQGDTVAHLYKSNLEKLALVLPSPEEQQKIADCLSSLNTLIAAQAEKIDVLKIYKKGLMQQLFPREDETVPRLRFPEFREAGEWTTKELGKLGEVLMCKRIFADQTNDQGGVAFFKIGTLGGEPDSYISKELFNKYKTKYNYPKKGEVLISCSGTVGKCLRFDGKDAYFQDSNIVWIDNPDLEISNQLLHLLLLNVDWSRLNSTTITRIYGSDLRRLSITFPSLPEEQEKIAECLSSIDSLIAAHVEKLDVLKTHKKGLMQKLFPSPETMGV